MTTYEAIKQWRMGLTPVSADAVEAVIGKPAQLIALKQSVYLDEGHQDLLRRSSIAGIGYIDEIGVATTTVAGGAVGFAEILDSRTIAFSLPAGAKRPEREAGIGMVFLFPGVGETLRLNGRASSISDNRVVLSVDEVYIHCSRAVSRSGLWNLPARPVSEPPSAPTKQINENQQLAPLDDIHISRIMANAPFLIVTSFGSSGSADSSPRGDAPGFVHKLSGDLLAIPDRKGNQRADTFHNLTIDQRISIAALVPGTNDIAVISGTAAMSTDPDLLEDMALNATAPLAAIVVKVTRACVVAAPAVTDAALWSERGRVTASTMPDMNALAASQIARNAGAQSHGMLSVLLRVMNAVPGLMSALTRFGLNKALAEEGYSTRLKDSTGGKRRARVVSVKREANDVISVFLKDVDHRPFDFKPGQYFSIAVKIDGQIYRRAYSASDLAGSQLRLTIKRQPDGIVSNYIHQIRRGEIVEISGPNGKFTPVASIGEEDLVLIGAGSGITPLYAAARGALQTTAKRVILLYGCRTEKDIVFNRDLHKLTRKYRNRFILRIILTRSSDAWMGRTGRISAELLRTELQDVGVGKNATYWICGPDPMMTTVVGALQLHGIIGERIHQERFTSAGPLASAVQAFGVNIRRGQEHIGAVTVEPGETILDAALNGGLPMRYSCAVGECGECAVRLLEGSVEMSSPNCLSESQIKDNIVLTCVGRPISATVIDIDYSFGSDVALGTGYQTWKTVVPAP